MDKNEDDPNILDTILKWNLPCNTGGTLKAFEVGYRGFRIGYANHTNKIFFDDFAQNYTNNQVFSYNSGELKRGYQYSFSISALISEINEPGEWAYIKGEYLMARKFCTASLLKNFRLKIFVLYR